MIPIVIVQLAITRGSLGHYRVINYLIIKKKKIADSHVNLRDCQQPPVTPVTDIWRIYFCIRFDISTLKEK